VRVGILSDTHDRVPAVEALLARFAEAGVALVLHCGDYCAPFALGPFRDARLPLLGTFGRNDGDRDALRAAAGALPAGGELVESPHSVELGGRTVLLVHDLGDALARSVDAHDVVVFGCSHRPEARQRGSSLLVNPGEACGWLIGEPRAAVLDLTDLRVEPLSLGPDWRC
jgi:putative phosphoesterase